jgi:hypothetical protein
MSVDVPGQGGKRLGTDIPAAEFRRLGKPGAYRLGLLRAQGIPERRQPIPFRARFVRRRDHRWRTQMWLVGMVASVAVIAVATAVGLVFAPLLAGVCLGFANRAGSWPPRIALPAVAAMAGAGWILPFLVGSAHGTPGGGLTSAAAAVTGLPADAAGVAALTMLIAIVQALAGYFFAGVIMPRLLDDRIR